MSVVQCGYLLLSNKLANTEITWRTLNFTAFFKNELLKLTLLAINVSKFLGCKAT